MARGFDEFLSVIEIYNLNAQQLTNNWEFVIGNLKFTISNLMTSPSSSDRRFFKYRIALLISIIVIIPLGYVVRFSRAPAPEWFNDSFGSIAYEVFWILLTGFLWPRASLFWTAMGVCLATCGVEFLQLWQPPFLQAMRATLPGRLILGNSFAWSDFPSYFVGSFLGLLWVRWLHFTWFRLH